MRQKIKGRVYDTNKANLIDAFYNFGVNSDYDVYEYLYKKYNGEYFLLIHGGSKSKYGAVEWYDGYGYMPVDKYFIIPIHSDDVDFWRRLNQEKGFAERVMDDEVEISKHNRELFNKLI